MGDDLRTVSWCIASSAYFTTLPDHLTNGYVFLTQMVFFQHFVLRNRFNIEPLHGFLVRYFYPIDDGFTNMTR